MYSITLLYTYIFDGHPVYIYIYTIYTDVVARTDLIITDGYQTVNSDMLLRARMFSLALLSHITMYTYPYKFLGYMVYYSKPTL